MDSKKARKLKEGFLVKKVGKLPVNFNDIQVMQLVQHCFNTTERQSHRGFRSMKS